MLHKILSATLLNSNRNPLGPAIRFEFSPGDEGAIIALEEACPKPILPDGRLKNSRTVYSDDRCEIISNRIGRHIMLCKTLPLDAKYELYEHVRPGQGEEIDRVQHAVFTPDDMHAIHSSLEKLGFDVSAEWLTVLAACINESKSGRIITLNSGEQAAYKC